MLIFSGLSYYSDFYQRFRFKETALNQYSIRIKARACGCNDHSQRCEQVPNAGLLCVDCRHNTEGRHCHRCKRTHYRVNGTSIKDPNSCQGKNIMLNLKINFTENLKLLLSVRRTLKRICFRFSFPNNFFPFFGFFFA